MKWIKFIPGMFQPRVIDWPVFGMDLIISPIKPANLMYENILMDQEKRRKKKTKDILDP